MHPLSGRQVGWEQVAQMAAQGQVRLHDQLVRAGGDLAYEVGTERGAGTLAGQPIQFEHRVTNVYRREAGGWKLVHHHTDVSPGMQDLVSRLQAPPQ
jgi:ketosteroid isomerase-like protein